MNVRNDSFHWLQIPPLLLNHSLTVECPHKKPPIFQLYFIYLFIYLFLTIKQAREKEKWGNQMQTHSRRFLCQSLLSKFLLGFRLLRSLGVKGFLALSASQASACCLTLLFYLFFIFVVIFMCTLLWYWDYFWVTESLYLTFLICLSYRWSWLSYFPSFEQKQFILKKIFIK